MSFLKELSSIQFLLACAAVINITGLALMYIDKARARRHAFRVPEATLFIVAIFGGSIGCLLGMYLFRHKTKKWYFRFGMPAILILQIAGLILLWCSPYEFIFL